MATSASNEPALDKPNGGSNCPSRREDRRSRSRDDRRRSPSTFCHMTLPKAACEAMQKALEEYNRRSKNKDRRFSSHVPSLTLFLS